MKKIIISILLILLLTPHLYSQRIKIENEKLKSIQNKAMFDLILFAQLFPIQKSVYPVRDIKSVVDQNEYAGAKGDIWFSKLSMGTGSGYCGVWAEIDESMTIFASFYTENDSLKFCMLQRESGVIKELDNYTAPISQLEVIPTKNNKLLERFITKKGTQVIIKETNKISGFNFSNAIFMFPDYARSD